MAPWQHTYKDKLISAEQAASLVKSDSFSPAAYRQTAHPHSGRLGSAE